MELSANKWLASKDPAEIDIKAFPVKGTKIKLRCSALCGPLLAAFAAEFNQLVEPIEKGELDDWGYAYRPVRGETTGLSNHASGTAIDINATKHPLGKSGTFTKEQEVILQKLVVKYGLRWGGNYHERKDEMHYEIVESPLQVKARMIKLGL